MAHASLMARSLRLVVRIPRLGPDYSFPLAGGVSSSRTLDPIGLGHYPDTAMPGQVGNFAIDLPDANVLIQVSGTFGSRQEEAQRLGRVLRPKSGGENAHFFTLVTRDTRELDFAHHRQMFLT